MKFNATSKGWCHSTNTRSLRRVHGSIFSCKIVAEKFCEKMLGEKGWKWRERREWGFDDLIKQRKKESKVQVLLTQNEIMLRFKIESKKGKAVK